MQYDRNGLEILSRDECMRLLASSRVGRIGLTSSALPVVLPVNFTVWRDAIVVRTTAGTKLDAAARSAVVAFEADETDRVERGGWSVVVTGVAEKVTDPDDIAELRAADAGTAPWSAEGDHFIRISTEIISGRRVTPVTRPLIHVVDARSSMELVGEAECLGLLAEETVGRIVLVDHGRPVVFPVNYAWDGSAVVLRSDAGRLLAAGEGSPVAFEIDHFDPVARTGWSVVVDGALEDATEQREHDLVVEPWAPGTKANWFRIVPRRVTGRRVDRGPAPAYR